MNIAEILKSLRIEKGLTQNELAERLNIGQATIACYENGQREPHISNLIAYADYFECTLDYIVGRTDDFGNVIIGVEKTKNGINSLTKEERCLLDRYHKLTGNDKMKIEGYIDSLTNK